MSEGPPQTPSHEGEPPLTRERVVEALKASPEDFSLLDQYRSERERTMRTSADTLAYNLEEARILRDAGLIEHARSAYEDVIEMAYQEGDDRTRATAEAELRALPLHGL